MIASHLPWFFTGSAPAALKLGRVRPGLDQVRREIEKAQSGSTMTAATATFTS